MATQLRLAGTPAVGTPAGTYGHFQIVYYVSNAEQYEIEVLPSGSGLPGDNWTYPDYTGQPANLIKNTPEHPAHNNPAPETIPGDTTTNKYNFAPIYEGAAADRAWFILKQVHKQFYEKGKNIPYLFDNLN